MSDPKLNLDKLLGRIKNEFLAGLVVVGVVAILSIVALCKSKPEAPVFIAGAVAVVLLAIVGWFFVSKLNRSLNADSAVEELQEQLKARELAVLRQKTSGEVSNLFVVFAEASIGLDVPQGERRTILIEYLEQAFLNRAEQLQDAEETELAAWLSDMARNLHQESDRRKAIQIVRRKEAGK